MFSSKYVAKYIKNFLFLFFTMKITIQFLVFPFKTYHPDKFTQINNSNSFSKEDLLNYWLPNEMYTYLNVGFPPSKVYTFFDSQNYGSYMDNSICKLPSKYNNDSSSTFSNISNYIVSFSGFNNMCFAKETFSAYTTFDLNENKRKTLPNITFLYAVNPFKEILYSKFNKDIPITGFSCFHIGLQLPTSSDYYDSLIIQLKKYDYIETEYWTIEFNNKDNNKKGLFELYDNEGENEGYFIIGLPPHKYNPNKYNEERFRTTISKIRYKNYEDYRVNVWGILFDQIYFISNNSTKNEIILKSTKCKLSLDINLIEETGYSFPSGPSLSSMAFYGFIIYLLYTSKLNNRSKNIFIILFSLLILVTGISRIYLGVHYLTDVLGAFIFGIVYLVLFIKYVYNNEEIKTRENKVTNKTNQKQKSKVEAK